MTLIVNLFGGPGTGKSTTAAGVFHQLKMNNVNAELVTEYAKDLVWEEAFNKLDNQLYVFAKQHNRLYRCIDKVDVIVTDSPINLGLIYGEQYNGMMSEQLKDLIKYEFDKQNNLNVFLHRGERKYNPKGRMQTEEEAQKLDKQILHVLKEADSSYINITVGETACHKIVHQIMTKMTK